MASLLQDGLIIIVASNGIKNPCLGSQKHQVVQVFADRLGNGCRVANHSCVPKVIVLLSIRHT